MSRIKVNKPFEPLYDKDKHTIILNNPRISGKSFEIAQLEMLWKCKYPNHDIICCRANANSLEESMVAEVEEKFDLVGKVDEIEVKKQPLRIEHKGCKGEIYFKGISGHDKSRVRSIKPKNPVSAIIIDECQQISSEENLKHALATFRRYLDTSIDYKILLSGNPHEIKGHWWNTYCAKYKGVKGYSYINSTYKDIARVLNKEVLEDIELEKEINPALYKFMYLGDLSELNGGAYPSFNRDKHVVSWEQAQAIFNGEIIEMIIFGGDGAITHDATGIVPIAIMSSGRCVVLERFIFEPLVYGRALAPSELAELIERYLDDMDRKYQIVKNDIECHFAIDCASADLITQLRYQLDEFYDIKSYTDKNIIRNNSAVNNCFARGMCYIVDFGGYYDYASDKFIKCDVDPLVNQLESVVWKGNKYDPAIPNDISDALTYGLAVYYENPYNLYLPEKQKNYN